MSVFKDFVICTIPASVISVIILDILVDQTRKYSQLCLNKKIRNDWIVEFVRGVYLRNTSRYNLFLNHDINGRKHRRFHSDNQLWTNAKHTIKC